MKKYFILLIVLIPFSCIAQWSGSTTIDNNIYRTGDVGIGASNPSSKLHVKNGDIIVESSLGSGSDATIKWRSSEDQLDYFKIQIDEDYNNRVFFSTLSDIRMTFTQSGYLGLGTITPSSKFHVYQSSNSDWSGIFQNTAGSGKGVLIKGSALYSNVPLLQVEANNSTPIFFVSSSGTVGIGTQTPDAKLAVKGKIHAEEVRIDLLVPGPDYVFNNDYDLKTLEEIEKYIEQNGHLPDIQPAREMERNGIELGEMNMKLLQKIEELTLYMIDFKKEMDKMREENQKLKDRIIELEKD